MKTLKTISAVIAIVICNVSIKAQVEDSTNVVSRTIILKPHDIVSNVYKNNDVFEFELETTIPLANMYGYDSVIVYDNEQMFVFPPNRNEIYTYQDIVEVKMEEKGMYDKHKKEFVFKTEQIEFTVRDRNSSKRIQLDLNRLKDKNQTYDWEDLLSIRKFYGFYCCN